MRALSLELRYLIYTTVLMGLMWVPYIVAQIRQSGPVLVLSYSDQAGMPAWAARLKQAHYNLLENLPLLGVAVIAGEFRGIHTSLTAACAMVFFWARVAHPVAAVSNIFGTRTVTFTVAWVAALVYLFAVLSA